MATTLPATITATTATTLKRLDAWTSAARDALSPNTVRALRADSAIFSSWCATSGCTALPASPTSVAEFIKAHAGSRSPATVRRYVSSITTLHRAAGLPSPTSDERVRLALKALTGRGSGRTRRQKQARGINELDVERVLATATESLADRRDVALLLVGRDMLARRSEVVALEVGDLTPCEDGGATALVRFSKTDTSGEGAALYISPRSWAAVRIWLEAAGITTGPVFRSLRRGGHLRAGALDAGEVPGILRRLAKRARIDGADRISGHSLRVGMAQDLVAAGAELPAVMQAGRWRSPAMPARYAEKLLARRGAVAEYYRSRSVA